MAAFRCAATLHDVAVQAADTKAGKPSLHLVLDPLGPSAEIADPGRAAVRAAGRNRRRAATVVAAERGPSLVVDERSLALGTGLDVAAVAAEDD